MDELTAKEWRLLDYLADQEELGHNPTIGEIRKACKTTVRTLLGKTLPSLKRKMDAME